jgi:DNA/RNA endonuclease YhcR with UshA esterase domain
MNQSAASGILTTNWTDTYVQDESERGINVYRGGTPVDPLLKRGNLVRVAGEVTEYLGILEIENYTVTVLANNQPLPEAIVIMTDEATGIAWEGTFVKVKGVILELYSAGGGTNIIIDDGSGPVTIRAWDTAGLDFSEYAVGDNIEVNGVVDIYLDAGQVLLAYQEDISFTEIAKSPLLLKVPNRPFVPDQGETLPIIYSAGTENSHVTLRIYDMAGRLITTPVDEIGRSFEQTFEWNGTDQVNEQVGLGAYILFFEVVSNTDGTTEVKTAPIVVGTILKN